VHKNLKKLETNPDENINIKSLGNIVYGISEREIRK